MRPLPPPSFRPVFDVHDYGAAGDGVTDDAAAFAAAESAADNAGGIVLLRAKTYIIGTTIAPSAGVVFQGQGMYATTVKVKDGATFNLFQPSCDRTGFRDLTIDGNSANTTGGSDTSGNCIYWASTPGGVYGAFAERVRVINSRGVGIRYLTQVSATDAAALDQAEVTLRDCIVTDGLRAGIWIHGATDSVIERCISRDNGNAGFYMFKTRGTVIQSCHALSNASHGIVWQYVRGGGTFNSESHDNTGGGIVWGGSGDAGNVANIDYAAIGNYCSGNGTLGIDSDSTVYVSTVVEANLTFIGNRCWDNGSHGIYLQNADGAVVQGNICWDNGGSGIAGQGRRFTLTGNHLYDNAVNGINIQGSYTAWSSGLVTSSNATSGTVRKPTVANGFIYRCTVAGTTDALEPTWPTTTGATVVDGTVTWVATPIPGFHTLSGNNLHGNTTADYSPAGDVVSIDGGYGSETKDWGSIADGDNLTEAVTVQGAALGMIADASMSVSLDGLQLTAYVSAVHTVTCVLSNTTGAPVDLGSGTLYAKARLP